MLVKCDIQTIQKVRLVEYEGQINVSIEEKGIQQTFRFNVTYPFREDFVLTIWKGDAVFLELKGASSSNNICHSPSQKTLLDFFIRIIIAGLLALHNKYCVSSLPANNLNWIDFLERNYGAEASGDSRISCVINMKPSQEILFCAA